ncbi:thiamine phosphate synthase [Sphingomonas sp. 28-63-12]|uniref:thiamine phosphate synthase n=1 Tax=Sphingomonas sp. 28-63-12 TaxID=1970434 RepID=UPI0035A9984A
MGDALWPALERVPPGGGVIFRHYGLGRKARRALFVAIRRVARRRRLILLLAGEDKIGVRADGFHGRSPHRLPGIRSWPAHGRREVIAGGRAGADAILISPVFATRSHPGARMLGAVRAAALATLVPGRAIALGGAGPRSLRRLAPAGFEGWAAIDAWLAPDRTGPGAL